MSLGFHQAYCKPCQKSRAWRIRRISCRRATTPSWRYCRTSSRNACTSSGFASSSRSLFGPRSTGGVVVPPFRAASSPFSRDAGLKPGATPPALLPSAGAIAPGTPAQDSDVWYWSIRPLSEFLVKVRSGVAVGSGFAPGLHLVPGALPQARQRLRLGRFGKLHRRKSRRAEKRIHQGAILCPQARYFAFEQADVTPLEQSLEKISHVYSMF